MTSVSLLDNIGCIQYFVSQAKNQRGLYLNYEYHQAFHQATVALGELESALTRPVAEMSSAGLVFTSIPNTYPLDIC